jgi:hypothetical protein
MTLSKSNRTAPLTTEPVPCREPTPPGWAMAMRTGFPVTLRIAGAAMFDRMARDFFVAVPPREPDMSCLGRDFPAFICGYAPAAALPHLSDIARLDAACSHARRAPHVTPLPPDALRGFPHARLGEVVLTPLPSLRFVASAHPVARLWHAHQAGPAEPETVAPDAAGETALVWRSDDTVRVQGVRTATFTFVLALATGQPLDTARASAVAVAPDFRFAAELEALLAARAFGEARLPDRISLAPRPNMPNA